MPVTQTVLRRLAMPLNRGDFPAFVQAIQDLPTADRDVLAILGACDLLGHAATLTYLSQRAARDLVGWASQFRGTYVDELPAWPVAPDTRD